MNSSKYDSFGERVFDVFNYLFLTLFALVTVLPFVYIIAGRWSPYCRSYISSRARLRQRSS